MKTIESIINNYSEWRVDLDDRFGRRLCQFLTEEQMEQIGYEMKDEYKGTHKTIPFTRENILEQLKADVAFGMEKAYNQRGISSGLMFEVVLRWNRVLEEGLENWNPQNYYPYGLPLFRETAKKYDWKDLFKN